MGNTEVLEGLEAEPDDGRPRFPVRRIGRWATVLVIGILAFLAAWQDPLYALRG